MTGEETGVNVTATESVPEPATVFGFAPPSEQAVAEPAPEPIDPSTLGNYHSEGEEEALPEEGEDLQASDGSEDISDDGGLGAAEEQQENREETQEAAEEAGVIPESEDQPDAT